MEEKNLTVTDQGAGVPAIAGGNMFFVPAVFEHAKKVALMLSSSSMVPDHFRGNQNAGNCMIALNYANRVGTDVFMTMQNMYVVHGRPGIESKFAIALFNDSGKFSPLRYKFNYEKTKCHAWAKDLKSGEKVEGPAASIELAKAEGWFDKKGSKWRTMPELMLMYRAAMFFVRMYSPEILLGMQSREELDDVFEMTPTENGAFSYQETGTTGQEAKKTPDPVQAAGETTNQGPDPDEVDRFDVTAAELNLNAKLLFEFLDLVAKGNVISVDEVKVEALENIDGFFADFKKWANQKQKTPEPGGSTSGSTSGSTEPDPPAEDGADGGDEWDAFRSEFINLREKSFPTFVFKNKSRLIEAPIELYNEAKDKWARLFKDEHEWPVSRPDETTDAPATDGKGLGEKTPENANKGFDYLGETVQGSKLNRLINQYPQLWARTTWGKAHPERPPETLADIETAIEEIEIMREEIGDGIPGA